jgi:hypothetical protein
MRFEVTRSITNMFATVAGLGVIAGVVTGFAGTDAASARSVRIENKIAVFSALDKVTARISKIEIPLNETVQFGSLKVTPRVCYSRDPTEPPKTTSFVEVRETLLNGEEKKVFSGWMFAESPGLHAVEHPVFDVWLTGCAKPVQAAAASGRGKSRARSSSGPDEPPPRRYRRRRVQR